MKQERKKLAIVIGRFQPFHNMHQNLLHHAASVADNVLVLVGSSMIAPNVKNPWTFREREHMIRSAMGEKVKFVKPLIDYHGNDNRWMAQVQAHVDTIAKQLGIVNSEITIVGFKKDSSSYYLDLFPQWDKTLCNSIDIKLNATSLREVLFDAEKDVSFKRQYLSARVPELVMTYLASYWLTDEYRSMCGEATMLNKYLKDWSVAPYKPTFVTVDAVVVCSGHVLMVERKHSPGKGLFALPGGFLNQNETIENGIIRELKEETRIGLGGGLLKNAIQKIQVFDHPGRSLRGRTITHAGLLPLNYTTLPEIEADDDAADALWLSFEELASCRERIFEDHLSIIETLTGFTL